MSESVRGKEDIRRILENHKQYYIDYLELLEKVSFNRKKDGTPFQNINKNFNNGCLFFESYSDEFHPQFKVSGRVSTGNYQSFTFDCYIYEENLPKDDERRNLCKSTASFMKKTYCLTITEIEQKIESEKAFCKRKIENYEKQIERLEVVFGKVEESVKALKQVICESGFDLREDVFPTSLEYALRDYAKYNL